MSNDSKEERGSPVDQFMRGRGQERTEIVKWLRERAASWRRFPSDANVHGEAHQTASSIADSVEGLAAAIERGSHRS